MPTIRIDDDVMSKLQALAIEEGLVFSSPNTVLRISLGLDEASNDSKGTHSTLSTSSQTENVNVPPPRRKQSSDRRLSGQSLLRQHKDLSQQLRAHAHVDGTFYKWPDSFPAILFNSSGYVIFRSEESMINSRPQVASSPNSRKINIRNGINSLSNYVECNHNHIPD